MLIFCLEMSISIPYHHRNASGNGLGGILRSLSGIIRPLYSSAKTVLSPLGRELKKEGVSLLKNTANDILSGNTVENSLQKNISGTKKRIKKKVLKAIKGKQQKKTKGTGVRKKRKKVKKSKGSGRRKTNKKKGRGKKGKKKKATKKASKKSSLFDAYHF